MTTDRTPITLPLRVWLFVEVLFGLGAISSITLFPAETKTNFAWPIQPVIMAALLGAFYIATAPTLVLALFARYWESVRVIVLPAIAFTTVELVATFLHWDKFSVGTVPFYVWFASYLLPPPIFAALYWWQQRRAGPFTFNNPLNPSIRQVLLGLGGLLTLVAVITFIFPNWLIAIFPWKMTPLTTRALCGWLIAVGTLMLSMARENDRYRVRLGAPQLILLLPAVVLQLARYPEQVQWDSPTLWVGLVLLAIIGVCGLYLALGDRRSAQVSQPV